MAVFPFSACFLNKNTARLYLKLLGRYTPGFEHLNLIKPRIIKKNLNKYKDKIDIISLGEKEFVQKFNDEQIEKIGQSLLRKSLKLLHCLPVIEKSILTLVCWTKIYYPVTVISKKKLQ